MLKDHIPPRLRHVMRRAIHWTRFLLIEQPRRLFSSDELERHKLLHQAGRLLLPRYRFIWPQMTWWDDQEFNAYLERFGELGGMNTDRHWTLAQLLRLVQSVPGDTAECGVFRGASSYLICRCNEQNHLHTRVHHMFDSFAGLSAPSEVDGDHWNAGNLACGLEETRENLAGLEGTRYYQGWIPERFPEVADRRFCFVHVDVDIYQPTRDSIEFFYPRLNTGGILVCDDYGFSSCPGATRAIDEFLADKPEGMIHLGGGSGFFIKDCPTGPPVKPLPQVEPLVGDTHARGEGGSREPAPGC